MSNPILNHSIALFLVNEAVRAVNVSYEVDAEGKGRKPFVMFKTLDPSIKPGDFVVIPTDTRHQMTVVRVEEVDVEVDFNSGAMVHWIVDTVSRDSYGKVIAAEQGAIDQIKAAETARRKKELAEKLIENNPDLAVLRGLDVAALPAPPAETYTPPAPEPFDGGL